MRKLRGVRKGEWWIDRVAAFARSGDLVFCYEL